MTGREEVVGKVRDALVRASTVFPAGKTTAYELRIESESRRLARWSMETLLENAQVAERSCSPLCDDTGIPHLVLEVGRDRAVTGGLLDAIQEGVCEGLRTLPGRPMAVLGDSVGRIEQRSGLDYRPEAVVSAPLTVFPVDVPERLRLTVLMQGGGPEIRSKTYRVFHKHSLQVVIDEVVEWASEVVGQLGCTPCTLAVGIGRSHYEASSMMLKAMCEGDYAEQTDVEREITDRVNATGVGPLGLGGDTTVLATFLKVGPQRASGVRIVCLRPCCCFEPRRASVDL